ncbi:MAG TPA: GNAT family N-acetyltransferase [Parafilimonas sp.]|nr:GNAT family N-acetyltransferase [Parafilimonas sp.]
MKDINIRIATNKDAALIADLSRDTFCNAFAPFNTKEDMDKFMAEVFTREKLMAELDLPDNIFLLAYAGENVAGYVRMRDRNKPEVSPGTDNVIEIARIYTVTAEIAKGIGTALMQECISISKQKQRDYLWLGVWENNDKAIRFYERFGFKRFGEHEFLLGNDRQTDWLMMLKL